VDFIVYGTSQSYAIEVKNAAIIHPKDLSGLKAFWALLRKFSAMLS